MEVTRQLAAIVYTDISGFTDLTARDESAAFAALERQRELLKPLVAQHGGEWLKEIGAGLLLSFLRSVKAVHCALAFSKDGTRLASGDANGVVKIWSVPAN